MRQSGIEVDVVIRQRCEKNECTIAQLLNLCIAGLSPMYINGMLRTVNVNIIFV